MGAKSSPPYRVTEWVAIGPRPGGSGGPSMRDLAAAGYGHVIDLNADPDEGARAEREGISYHPLRTTDETGTEQWLANLGEVVRIIGLAVSGEEKVYLHCTYGVGRSPTMAMGYLVASNRWTPSRAIRYVKSRGEGVWSVGNPTEKYRQIVEVYARLLRREQEPPP
ncbi:MAG: dual specificity protein phosphatase [Nitrososphaerales archaeon]